MKKTETLLHNCLYFTANSLSRKITRLADECFRVTGLSPSHAFLMMLVNDTPGICPNQLSSYLNLAPSTVTRLVDTLINKGLLTKTSQGKNTFIQLTEQGQALQSSIADAWKVLYVKYSDILGEQQGKDLTAILDAANRKL